MSSLSDPHGAAEGWIPYGRWVADRLRRYRHREAVVFEDRSYTYLDLEQRISQIVQSLRSVGLKPGQGLGLLGLNSFDYLALLLAMPVAGLHYTPMHSLSSSADHMQILREGELSALVADPVVAEASAIRAASELPGVNV